MGLNKNRTVLNVLSQWAMQIANIVITFALIGYAINLIGAEAYGVWAAIISIIGYLTMLDAGMSVTVQYYVSRYSTSGDEAKLKTFYSTAVIVYGIAAVTAYLVCLWLSDESSIIFSTVPPALVGENIAALKWVGTGMFLFMLSMPSQGALMGLQRHYIKNIIEVFSLFSRLLIVVALFEMKSASLEYLGFAFFVASAIRLVLCQLVISRVEPRLKINFRLVNLSTFKQVFAFGGHAAFWSFATAIVRESGPFVALLLLGPKESTYVYVGVRLVRSVGVFIQSAAQVFLPVATSLKEKADNVGMQLLVLKGLRYCSLMAFSGAAMLIVFGESILWYWLGDSEAYGVVVATTLGTLGVWINQVSLSVIMGMKVLWPITLMMLFRLVFCIVLALLLGGFFGVTGVASGLIIPVAITSLFVIPYFVIQRVEVNALDMFKMLTAPAIIGFVVYLSALSLYEYWKPVDVLALLFELALMLIIFISLALVWGLDKEDRFMLRKKYFKVSGVNID